MFDRASVVTWCVLVATGAAVPAGARNRDPDAQFTEEPAGAEREAASETTVVVGSRETLSAIARRHGVTVAALCAANGITNPDRVRAGQRLRVPAATRLPAPTRPPARVEEVRSAEPRPVPRSAPATTAPAMARAARQVIPPPPTSTSPFETLSLAPAPDVEPTDVDEPVALVTDVYGLRELVRAPTTSRPLVVRAAPAAPRAAVEPIRVERMGAVVTPRPTARDAARRLFRAAH